MAHRKEPKEIRPAGKTSEKQQSESSPNPHGENKILQMPIRTQQRNENTGKNIPQVPNTIGGNLNPSVAHDFENRATNDKSASDKRARSVKPAKEKDA
jgi:hypothetical protein